MKRLALPLMATALAACQDVPEVAYETEHFEVAPDFDHPVCAGTLAHFEDQLTFAEAALSRTVPHGQRIRFYWITGELNAWCSSRAIGCYYPGTRVIIGTGESASHEIIHAVLNAEGQTNLFLEEALAELYSGVGVSHRADSGNHRDPSEMLWLSPAEYRFGVLDYEVASHFMAYVHTEYGAGAIRRLADVVVTGAGPPELEQAFERFTTLDFASFEAKYKQESRTYYPGLRDADIAEITNERWRDVSLRCGADTTFGPLPDASPGMYRSLRLELDEPGFVEVELRAPEDVRATFVDLRSERSTGTVVDVFHPKLSGRRDHDFVRGGETRELHLRAGTHLVVIEREDYRSATVFLRAQPLERPRSNGG